MRAMPSGQRPQPWRALVSELLPRADDDMLDLRAPRAVSQIHDHRPTLVRGMQATLGRLFWLR